VRTRVSKRQERLNSQMVREVSDILIRKISDPRLQWVTIIRAQVSPDIREARIFIRTLAEGEEKQKVLTALRGASGFIRYELGKRLKLRVIPNIIFEDSEAELSQAEKVVRIISKIQTEKGVQDG